MTSTKTIIIVELLHFSVWVYLLLLFRANLKSPPVIPFQISYVITMIKIPENNLRKFDKQQFFKYFFIISLAMNVQKNKKKEEKTLFPGFKKRRTRVG